MREASLKGGDDGYPGRGGWALGANDSGLQYHHCAWALQANVVRQVLGESWRWGRCVLIISTRNSTRVGGCCKRTCCEECRVM
jgi:hypothetical protein